jgi:hypothetical protein
MANNLSVKFKMGDSTNKPNQLEPGTILFAKDEQTNTCSLFL